MGRQGYRFALSTCCLLLVFCHWGAACLYAQESETEIISREYRIKAAYLYQLGRYVEWPPRTFESPTAPFMIGVFADSVITNDLLQIAQSKKIQDRPIEIRVCTANSDFSVFQILFLPANLDPKLQNAIIRQTLGKHILLVGESSVFLNGGGAIAFVIEENNVRLYIARKAIERQGLTVSAKLLQVSRVVD